VEIPATYGETERSVVRWGKGIPRGRLWFLPAMRVLHVSTTAQLDGAGIAAYRLHKGLRSLGTDSWMLVNKTKEWDNYTDFVVSPATSLNKAIARLYQSLDRIPGRLSGLPVDRISASWVPNRLTGRINTLSPDIINLHWVNDGLMRIEALPGMRRPIVWTLHDMWAFSGGEHYVGDSTRYKEGYTAANRPAAETGLDVNRWIWRRKKRSWSKTGTMVIAAPSQWMAQCASESKLFGGRRIEVMPNGVDHDRFHPVDHAAARSLLGLPADKKMILFGAGASTSDRRKGFHLLVNALKELETEVKPDDYYLVVFGAYSGDDSFSINTHYLGRLRDEISMALVYAAADVFVAPSMEENLANTVLESLSCGTPVVAFDIGGMPDMIGHEKSGYLADPYDTGQLARGIRWVVENRQRWQRLSEAARNTVVRSFTLKHSAARYIDLYQELREK
jgi:glycosyltransferase involved in cell wall biosynthesis